MTGGKSGKGLGGTVRRAPPLPQRYVLSPEKVRTRLREMAALTARWEVTPTVPATAIVLDRHPGIAKELAAMDPAIHGHRHIPYAGLPASGEAPRCRGAAPPPPWTARARVPRSVSECE